MTGRSSVPVVLVADDDVELRDAVAIILEASGFQVLPASDGAEALAKARSSDVDIVLLDQNMPRKSGVEIQQALHEAGFTKPIIIISGVEALDGPSGSSQRWLKKPFDAEQLLAAVRQALADAQPIDQPRIGQPLSRAEEAPLGVEPVTRDSGLLMLIVEESHSIQRTLIECFRPDFHIVSAFNGHEGLRLATELLPDLIMVDVGLLRTSGEELIQQIRSRRELSEIPILVLATAEDPMQGVRLLEADAQDVVRKPFLLAEVRARAMRLLAAKRTRDILNEAAGHQDSDMARLAGDVLHRRRTDEITLKKAHDSQATAEFESRVKSGFLRMMAHELKTPITAMHLQMRLLEREAEIAHSPSLREGLVRIARSSHRLVQLIDTCIEWARVESKRCHLATETFDLVPLVSQIVGEFESHIERKGIRINVVPGSVPSLTSDRKLARLALLNLISYAVQNTDKGTVEVSLDAMEGVHRVWVTDGGPPIAEERHQELFSPFESNDDLRWQAGSGSGLGLYVVRDIVRAIGGDVVLEATERSGNTFLLSLPGLPESGARR